MHRSPLVRIFHTSLVLQSDDLRHSRWRHPTLCLMHDALIGLNLVNFPSKLAEINHCSQPPLWLLSDTELTTEATTNPSTFYFPNFEGHSAREFLQQLGRPEA